MYGHFFSIQSVKERIINVIASENRVLLKVFLPKGWDSVGD
jgi:hypothetical protein